MDFTALDRCDRCGAQAHYKATKPGSSPLLFCVHHKREFRDSLIEKRWIILSDQPEPVAVPASTE